METTQTSTIVTDATRSGWRKTDTMWMLGLYGTAIGAGVLFLPINAGGGVMCNWCAIKLSTVLVIATLYTSRIG